MAKKICIISDLHLSVNPRTWKEAFVYERMGYEVVILTQWTSDFFLERDLDLVAGHKVSYKAYLDIRPGSKSLARRFFYRARHRIACELHKRFGFTHINSVTYGPDLQLRAAMAENADLYSAHTESGFLSGRKLIEAGKRVGFDMEDWYSRDYLVPERAVELLHQAEGYALTHGVFFSTTSHAMANKIKDVWKVERDVTVIYNSFPEDITPAAKPVNKDPQQKMRILWTSRTIGPGRGLETLVQALAYVEQPVELHLIGKMAEGYEDSLRSAWSTIAQHALKVTSFLPHAELSALIPSFDLGLALEYNAPDNKDYTISNKILQYLQAGIMVLCTDTKGQMEVAERSPESMYVVPVNDVQAWANAISKAAELRSSHRRERQMEVYNRFFSWSVQEEKIQKMVRSLLEPEPEPAPMS